MAASGSRRADAQTPPRLENPSFAATLTGFQTSVGSSVSGLHYMTATLHLQNRTKKPLILGCERGKVTGSDDQGNRYVFASMRGVGLINGSTVDSKFVLPPEGGADALFELNVRLDARTVRGVTFDLNLALREITPLESGQVRLGTERTLEFTGLKNGLFADPSGRTIDAGPFTAQIVRSKVGTTPNRRLQTVDLTLSFKNTSDKPLILAYETYSSYGIDDQGIRYVYGRPGTHDTSVTGIGYVTAASADPQFVLAPGESREAHFVVIRDLSLPNPGTEMAYYVALKSLEILPSKQIREVRQFSLSFPGVSVAK